MRFPLENSNAPSCFAVTFSWARDLDDLTRYLVLAELAKLNSNEEGYLGEETLSPVNGPSLTTWFWQTRSQAESWKAAFSREWQEVHPSLDVDSELQFSVREVMQSSQQNSNSTEESSLVSFAELATSRRNWIDEQLRPWCRQAIRKDLLQAEADWTNIAGKVDATKTLWAWAWSRFPALVHEELGIDETYRVCVLTNEGQRWSGYPDARQSQQGTLTLMEVRREHSAEEEDGKQQGNNDPQGAADDVTFSIDDIREIVRQGASAE